MCPSLVVSASEKMADFVGGPFRALVPEVMDLHVRWQVFRQLYVSGDRKVELLNEVAPSFFALDQRIWFDAVVLGVARLLDDDRDTVSLGLLVRRVESGGPHEIVDDLKTRLLRLRELSAAILKYRDARLAHLAIAQHPTLGELELPPIQIANVDEVLKGISGLMNAVQVRYNDGSTADGATFLESDGNTLLWGLRKAANWDDLFPDPMDRHTRLLSDRYSDLNKS